MNYINKICARGKVEGIEAIHLLRPLADTVDEEGIEATRFRQNGQTWDYRLK